MTVSPERRLLVSIDGTQRSENPSGALPASLVSYVTVGPAFHSCPTKPFRALAVGPVSSSNYCTVPMIRPAPQPLANRFKPITSSVHSGAF